MTDSLCSDADLILHFVGGRRARQSAFTVDGEQGGGDDEALRSRILALPPDRFSEAVHFLRRLNLVVLLPNGSCGCGSTKFDIVAVDEDDV
jgi:hypothetical protein